MDNFRDIVLKEYPKLGLDDHFCFGCNPNVSCFGVCCHDVNIVLSPYDCLRLKRRLKIDSSEFLDKYTVIPFYKDQILPVVFLKMLDDAEKSCPFLMEDGRCEVYEDRPWPCRMYPVGVASGRTTDRPVGPEFYFIMKEDHCKGHEETSDWTIRGWIADQKVEPYERMGEFFKDFTMHPAFIEKGMRLDPPQIDMYMMALYDLDRFRRFIFESTFLQRFFVDEDKIERLRKDDEELLEFGFIWLRFALLRENTMKIKDRTIRKGV